MGIAIPIEASAQLMQTEVGVRLKPCAGIKGTATAAPKATNKLITTPKTPEIKIGKGTGLPEGLGKGFGPNSRSKDFFIGKLKGENIKVPDIKMEQITYTKRSPPECKQLRSQFGSTVRSSFTKDFAARHVDDLSAMGLSEVDIRKLGDGYLPKGYQVHHKLPLDDGGTNDFSNLVLMKNNPYHKSITNYQKLPHGLY